MIRFLRGSLYTEPTSWASLFVFIDKALSVCGFPSSHNLNRSILTTINYSVRFLLVLLWPIFAINEFLNQSTFNSRFDTIQSIFAGINILIKFFFLWLLKDERIKLSGRVVFITSLTDAATDRYQKISQKYCLLSSKIAALNLILYVLAPTAYIIRSLIQARNEWKLPLEMTIIGIPHHNYQGYAINLIVQVLQFIVAVPALLGFDLSFISYCLFTVSRMELCKSYCIFIGDKTGQYDTEKKQKELLKSLITTQSDAINFLNQFKTIFENCILVHLLTLMVLLSQALVQLLKEIQYIPILSVIAVVVAQILIYSIFGQMIISKNEELVKAIYHSNWYELKDISNRKMVLLMLLNAQHCQGFVIKGLFDLSLERCTEILKACYVFASFLRNIM